HPKFLHALCDSVVNSSSQATFAPHPEQKVAPADRGELHPRQNASPCAVRPQEEQNFASIESALPQPRHRLCDPAGAELPSFFGRPKRPSPSMTSGAAAGSAMGCLKVSSTVPARTRQSAASCHQRVHASCSFVHFQSQVSGIPSAKEQGQQSRMVSCSTANVSSRSSCDARIACALSLISSSVMRRVANSVS